MLINNLGTPANPHQGAAYSSLGYKTDRDPFFFSVGADISVGEQILQPGKSGDVKAVIEDSIITFSAPQTHEKLTSGDIVSLSGGKQVVLQRSLSPFQWRVRNIDTTAVEPIEDLTVVDQIEKYFETIEEALGASGISDVLSTSDFDVIGNSIGIVCLAQEETNQVVLSSTKWTNSSVENQFKIFCPRDETICNKFQFSGIDTLNTGMLRLVGGFDVDGVAFSFSGLSIESNSTIDGSPFWSITECKLSYDTNMYGVTVNTSPLHIVANNYSEYDTGGTSPISFDIDTSDGSAIVNNTLSKLNIGTTLNTDIWNNFFYSATFTVQPDVASSYEYNATYVALLGWMSGNNIQYIYYSNEDNGKPYGMAIHGLGRGGNYNLEHGYLVVRDIVGKLRDRDSWSIGCYDGSPEMPFSVSGEALYQVTGSLLANGEFVLPGTIKEGSLLTYGADSYLVGKQLNNGNYAAFPSNYTKFDPSGFVPFSSQTVDIEPVGVDINNIVGNHYEKGQIIDLGGGGPVSVDMNDERVNFKVIAYDGESENGVWTGRITGGNEFYNLILTGARTNTLEWDKTQYIQKSGNSSPHGIEAVYDGIKILNLQIESDSGSGVYINSGVTTVLIDSNYIRKCHNSGVRLEDYLYNDSSVSYITRNIIHKCYNGIFIESEFSKTYNTVHNTILIGNNVIKDSGNYGLFCKTNPEKSTPKQMSLVNNIINGSEKEDIFLTPYKSFVVSAFSTVTSDSSINELITKDRNSLSNYTVDFDKLDGTGFRIRLYTQNQLNNAVGYQVQGIGFVDYYGLTGDYFKVERHFSVGDTSANLITETTRFTIKNGVVKFDVDLPDQVSSGDVVQFDTGGGISFLFLQERGSKREFYGTFSDGTKAVDVTTYYDVVDIKRYSISLPDMLGNLSTHWIVPNTAVKIINNDDNDTIKDFGGDINVTGVTTFAPDYPLTVTVSDGRYLGGINNRHDGVKAVGYRVNIINGKMIFNPIVGYVVVEGFNGIGDNTTQTEIASATCELVTQFNLANGCAPGRGTTQPYVSISDIIFRQKDSDFYDFSGGGFAINSAIINVPSDTNTGTAFLTPSTLYNCYSYHCKLQTGAGNVFNSLDGLGGDFPRLEDTKENCHLTRYSYTAIGQGADIDFELDLFGATGNERYVYLDRSTNGRLVESLSIGPCSSNFETLEVNFSICGDTSNQTSVIDPFALIEGGIITFDKDINDIGVGIGAKVVFEDATEVILGEKISQNQWYVCLETGEPTPDKILSAVDGIYHFSNSLRILWDLSSELYIPYILTKSTALQNISACKLKINIWGYMSSFATTINGNTVIADIISDEKHFIDIKAPYDISKHCNTNHGPRSFNTDLYTPSLVAQDGNSPVLTMRSNYSRVSGFAVFGTGLAEDRGISTCGAKEVKVENNIIFPRTPISPEDGVNNPSYDGDSFNSGNYQYGGWKSDFTSNSTISLVDSDGSIRPQYWAAIFDDDTKRELIDVGGATDLKLDFKLRLYFDDLYHTVIYNDVMNFSITVDVDKIAFQEGATFLAYRNYPQGATENKFVDLRILRNGYLDSEGYVQTFTDNKYGIYYRTEKFGDWELLHDIEIGSTPLVDPNIGLFHYQMEPGQIGNGISNMCIYRESGSGTQITKSEFNTIRGNSIPYVDTNAVGILGTGDSRIYNNLVYEMSSGAVGIQNMFEDDTINCAVQDYTDTTPSDRQTYYQADNTIYCTDKGNKIQKNDLNHNDVGRLIVCKDPAGYNYSAAINDNRGNGLTINVDDRDCRGNLRGVTPDRFGWEYSADKSFIAVGDTTVDLRTGNPTYDIQDNILFFSQDQENLGVGMKIEDDVNFPGGGLYISEVYSKKVVKVTNEWGGLEPDLSNGVTSKISKVASDMTEAFSYVTGLYESDLVDKRVQVNFAIYNDSEDPQNSVNLSYVISDQDHFIRIFAPSGGKESIFSQRHDGTPNNGAILNFTPTYSVYNGLDFFDCHYVHIENLRIKLNSPFEGFTANVVNIARTFGAFLRNNIIVESPGDGIRIEKYDPTLDEAYVSKLVVFNNVVQKCIKNGIHFSDHEDDVADSFNSFKAMISNNTIVGAREGISVIPNKTSMRFEVSNNIVTDTILGNYALNFYPEEGSVIRNNSCDDDSLRYFNEYVAEDINFVNAVTDVENFYPTFSDKANGEYLLDSVKDKILINNAKDMSINNDGFPYNLDNINVDRPSNKWDIGAFEDSVIEGFLSVLYVTPYFDGIGFEGDFEIWADLYLRESVSTFLSTVPVEVQFTNIADLNAYALSHQGPENLRIHVEGDITFQGGFDLGDRGDKKVIIKTYVPEQTRGPGAILYDTDLVDLTNVQGSVEFIGLKIYHLNTGGVAQPFNGEVTWPLVFNNCIVGLRENTIVDGLSVEMNVINSLLLYKNETNQSLLHLGNDTIAGDGNTLNSMVLSVDTGQNVIFIGYPGATTSNTIANCLLYLYSDTYNLLPDGLPSQLINNIVDSDPLLEFFPTIDPAYNSETLFTNSFIPKNNTPAFNKGSNIYVTNDYDINGNARIYADFVVDIGPYELRIQQINFDENNIYKLVQGILTKYDDSQTIVNYDGEVFRDIYTQFGTDAVTREEFVKSEKYLLKLREIEIYNDYYNDKENKYVADFECYIDKEKMTLFLEKQKNTYGSLFNNIFNGGYVFYFDEIENRMYVYINDTFEKGCSGKRLETKLKV